MWYGTCGDASPDDERLKYPLPADDAGDKGVMGVLGDESRDDDADDVCVLIVVVCACESIFRFFFEGLVCRSYRAFGGSGCGYGTMR